MLIGVSQEKTNKLPLNLVRFILLLLTLRLVNN